ncbi:GntR family transcriptional regulator [Ramlibacter tataouinensis]|uniref:GntR family transcriptional regulator n=1 Tax=Ramlibacter tataouinensis TaxID=94132 RepID=UPI0022F3961F|nr:GntR family transcriptional regulator [Ramlibacter tataouinensis]WBY03139.1 GntR family transcriptional regulator [Ramlibacter tataouinensis]
MTSHISVFQKSRVPLYLQVAHLMRQKIERQEWPVDAQIPTLNELEREFQVSRITLRESLARLEEEGLIRRTRGRGTFVMKDLSQQRWFKLATSFEELVRTVSELKIRLIAIDEDDHPLVPHFAAGEVAGPYRRLRRVHYRDDRPYCLIEIYLAQDVFALDPRGFSGSPVIPKLAALPQVRIAAARQIMRVTVSDEDTAEHLDIGVADPIADVCRSLQDAQGRIVYYAHIQYPAQMIQVELDLFAGQHQPSPPASKKR